MEEKLPTEQDNETRKAALFFWALWLFLATTSAVFGYGNLADLWRPFVAVLPLSAGVLGVFVGVLGAGSAVLLLDGGYLCWHYVRINISRSVEQIFWARLAEEMSFWVSVYFTLAVLVDLVLADYFGGDLVLWIGRLGAVLFVVVAAVSGVCMRMFALNNPDTRKKSSEAALHGLAMSEQLRFTGEVKRQALLDASKRTDQAKERLSDMLATTWELTMMKQLLDALEDDTQRDVMQAQYDRLIGTGEEQNKGLNDEDDGRYEVTILGQTPQSFATEDEAVEYGERGGESVNGGEEDTPLAPPLSPAPSKNGNGRH